MTLPMFRLKIQSLTCYTPSRFLRVRLMSLSLENWMISSLEVNERALVVVLEVMVLLFLTGTENRFLPLPRFLVSPFIYALLML